jgi:hypothetical protein
MKIREIRGHYRGKTWAGATPSCRAAASAAAALVAPAHVSPETKVSTVPVPTKYQSKPEVQPKGEQL